MWKTTVRTIFSVPVKSVGEMIDSPSPRPPALASKTGSLQSETAPAGGSEDEAERSRFLQKLFKQFEFLIALCGCFNFVDGLAMILQRIAQSCLALEWAAGAGVYNLQEVALADRVNMERCKKFVELSHGFGGLFQKAHWRAWVAAVIKISRQLIRLGADTGLFKKVCAIRAGVVDVEELEKYQYSELDRRNREVFLAELRQHRADAFASAGALFSEVSVRLSSQSVCCLAVAAIEQIMVLISEIEQMNKEVTTSTTPATGTTPSGTPRSGGMDTHDSSVLSQGSFAGAGGLTGLGGGGGGGGGGAAAGDVIEGSADSGLNVLLQHLATLLEVNAHRIHLLRVDEVDSAAETGFGNTVATMSSSATSSSGSVVGIMAGSSPGDHVHDVQQKQNSSKRPPILLMDLVIKRFFDFIHATSDKTLQKEIINYLALIIAAALAKPSDSLDSGCSLNKDYQQDTKFVEYLESVDWERTPEDSRGLEDVYQKRMRDLADHHDVQTAAPNGPPPVSSDELVEGKTSGENFFVPPVRVVGAGGGGEEKNAATLGAGGRDRSFNQFRDRDWLRPLRSLLRSPDKEIRQQVCEALETVLQSAGEDLTAHAWNHVILFVASATHPLF